MEENRYWVWLVMVFGIANQRIWQLMNIFENPVDAYVSLKSDTDKMGLNEKEIEIIRNTDISSADALIESCYKNNVNLCGYSSEEYPAQLRFIMNPPAVLYYIGNINCLNKTKTVTAVGTRSASNYGLRATHDICRELALSGIVVVSSFAVGVDITSQLSASEVNCPSVAVMACGVDVGYPKENESYREKIINSGGLFISEYPPETQPFSSNFPIRNRILAGLGKIAIVFEANSGSGSLITARMSAEQGKNVYCLPPSDIFNPRFSGNIDLLRDGAFPLYDVQDVIEYLDTDGLSDVESTENDYLDSDIFRMESFEEFKENLLTESIDDDFPQKFSPPHDEEIQPEISESPESKKQEDNHIELQNLNDIQKKIFDLLKDCTLHADVIVQKLDVDSEDIMTELTEMEINGIVESLPGKMFRLSE